MVATSGTVIEIQDHGFVIDKGKFGTTVVATQTRGCDLGLRKGDYVSVMGGYGGGDVFLSSSATKELFGRFTVNVPVNSHERLPWWRRIL